MREMGRRYAVLLLAGLTLAVAQPNRRTRMLTSEQLELKHYILTNQVQNATMLARRMGPSAGDVLAETAGHEKASIRLLTLDVAVANPSPGACKAILALLGDSNGTVRSVAGSAIGRCNSADSLPQLVENMKQQSDPGMKSSLALAVGDAGTRDQLKDLAPLRASSDRQVAHDASLAMAKLGDKTERQAVIARIQNPDVQQRVQGLRDVLYLSDPTLAAHFGPALADERDAFPISTPHDPNQVFARVCDVAAQAMAGLRFQFTFPVGAVQRLSAAELAEVRRIQAAYAQSLAAQPPQ